ncbi:hypothetical protein C8J57DRAFT_1236056 [Mycena rebaudengoi]|nr:hypothetical protein C8J57DRAFT_1236056 [Mycena rebaudengoi]
MFRAGIHANEPYYTDPLLLDALEGESKLALAFILLSASSAGQFQPVESMGTLKLPPEILGRALVLGIGSFPDDAPTYHTNRCTIRLVCALWDSIVLGTPEAWNHIFLQNTTPTWSIRKSIKQSGTLPLIWHLNVLPAPVQSPPAPFSYSIYCPNWDRLFVLLIQEDSRCISMFVESTDLLATSFIFSRLSLLRMTSLVDLTWEVHPGPVEDQRDDADLLSSPFLGDIPKLTTLTFTGTFVLWEPIPLYSNLHTLHLEDLYGDDMLSVDDFFNIFHTAVGLVDLHLLQVECTGFRTFLSEPPTLDYLTRLHFATQDDTSCCILSILKMPAFRTLRLDINQDVHIDTFLAHCTTTIFPVETLIFNVQAETLQIMAKLLYRMPCVRCLDIIDDIPFTSVAVHAVLLSWPGVCPLLTTLRLKDYLHTSMLDKLVLSRTSPFTAPGNDSRVTSPTDFQGSSLNFVTYRLNGKFIQRPVTTLVDYYKS